MHIYHADLDHALVCLTREDPSLRVSLDNETGQVCHKSGWLATLCMQLSSDFYN